MPLPVADCTIFIGDGSTDRFAAEVADIVFARRRLLRYCQTQGIECYPFEDFHPVTTQLRAWLEGAQPLPRAESEGWLNPFARFHVTFAPRQPKESAEPLP